MTAFTFVVNKRYLLLPNVSYLGMHVRVMDIVWRRPDSCGARHLEIAFGRETVLATRRRSHEPAVWQLRHPCGRELPGERPDRLTLNRAAIF
jgi:hypothetical protein